MAAEQPSSLSSAGLPIRLTDCEWPRVSPITITKNESQEYVISRPTRSTHTTGSESNCMMSSVTNSSYVRTNSYTDSAISNYQPFVRSTSTSESYPSIGNSLINEMNSSSRNNQSMVSCPPKYTFSSECKMISQNKVMTNRSGTTNLSSQNHYPPITAYSYLPSSSVDNPNYSLSQSKDATSIYADLANSSNIVSTVANYRTISSASSSSSTNSASLTQYSINASVNSCAHPKGLTSTDSGPSTSLNLSTSAHNCISQRGTPEGSTAHSSTIPFVDLTDSQNSGNSNHQWTNMTSSVLNESYQNAVACASVSSANVLFSPQISSTVMERTANSFFLIDNGCKLSPGSRQRISNLLSEITKLMKSTSAIKYLNEYKESHIQTQRKEENENTVDYGIELYRFNVYCGKNKPLSELIPMARKLLLICKTYCLKYVSIMFRKENINLQDEILIYNIRLFLINLNRLFPVNYMTGENTFQTENASSLTSLASIYSVAQVDNVRSRENKDKIYKYEQHIEWQKTQIIYLENKLKEKNEIEKKLAESQKKCKELEEKLKKKDAIGCWRQDNMTEWCCELMSELKITVLDLMENEFKCCICDELLIEPGVTNCNHVFCTVCLNTWRTKKKECPVCRASIVNVYKVNPIDEFITAATSSISDKAYAERLQVIEDRKNSNPPPAKKPYVSVASTLVSPLNIPLPLSLPSSVIPLSPPSGPMSFPNVSIPVPGLRIPPPAHSSASWSSSLQLQHQPQPQQQQTSTIWQPPTDLFWGSQNSPSWSPATRQPNSSWNRVPLTSRSAPYAGPVASDSS